MCALEFSLLSKITSKNLVCETTGICELYIVNVGSGHSFLLIQKCIQTVLVLENLKPFSSADFSTLLRHN